MTLQVALVGTDGIVLASDLKINSREANFNSSCLRSKILVNHERKIAACWSHDKDVSMELAERVISGMTDSDFEYPHHPVNVLAKQILDAARGPYDTQHEIEIAVVTLADPPRAYEINAKGDGNYICERCPDQIVFGHRANPARFFLERYYQRLPIAKLLALAAHVVVNAGRINPRGIEGLEIVLCTKEGFHRLSEQETDALTRWSDELDSKIMQQLFASFEAR
ncbi:MAG: hypothetical protein WB787_05695 [Candidatus Acidiferrales bacterium]